MKKNRIISALALVLFLSGIGLVLYPSVSNWVNKKNSTQAFVKYDKVVSEINNSDYEKMIDEAVEHNKIIQKAGSLGAAVYMENENGQSTYNKLLNPLNNGMMACISIPKINASLPVYHTTEESVLQASAGHYVGSSLPVGGESTHCVITGHRGLPSARLFTDLDLLEKGDIFYIDVLGSKLAYQVDQIKTVLPDIEKELDIIEGEDYVTLVTCTPYSVNTHRLLVRGTRIPYQEEVEIKAVEEANDRLKTETLQRVILVICSMSVVFGITILIAGKLKSKKYS